MYYFLNFHKRSFRFLLFKIPDEERYWLIHSRGYTLCRLLERMVDGKCRIRIGNDAELVVDSSDVDHANSTTFDRVADVASLKYVNETSVIHLLRQRYGSNLFFTGGGAQHLVYFLPMFGLFNDDTMDAVMPTSIASLDTPENRNLAKLFAECTRSQMPAHIYALAQQMYRLVSNMILVDVLCFVDSVTVFSGFLFFKRIF